jgi:hypothetical protein
VPHLPIQLSLLVGLFFILAGCGGGGGGDDASGGNVSSAGNLEAVGVKVSTETPNAGHQIALNTTIRSTQAYTDMPVVYALISKKDADAELDEIRVLFFGDDYAIPNVKQGAHDYSIKAIIPLESRDESEWYLTPIIDPQGTVTELNKDDNFLDEDSVVLLSISNENTERPDVVVASVDYDDNMVLDVFADSISLDLNGDPLDAIDFIDPETGDITPVIDTTNYDFGASIELFLSGANPLTINAYADLVTVSVVDGVEVVNDYPLLVWDAASGSGDYEYEVSQEIYPDESNIVELDFLIPGAIHEGVEEIFEEDIDDSGVIGDPINIRDIVSRDLGPDTVHFVRVKLDRNDEFDEYEDGFVNDELVDGITDELAERAEDDSEIWLDLNIVAEDTDPAIDQTTGELKPLEPDECRPTEYTKQFDKLWGGRYLSLALNVSQNSFITESDGALADLNATVPLTIFGERITIAEFVTQANVIPTSPENQSDQAFNQSIKALDVTIYTQSSLNTEQAFPVTAKSYKKERVFPLGGYPVTVSGSATAELGLELSGDLAQNSLSLDVGPYARIGGAASAGVDVAVVNIALEGELVLLKDELKARVDAQLSPIENNEIEATLAASLVNKLTGPNGSLKVALKLDSCLGITNVANSVIKTIGCGVVSLFGGSCSSRRIIPKCPQQEVASLRLASFSSFERLDTLVNVNREVRLCFD